MGRSLMLMGDGQFIVDLLMSRLRATDQMIFINSPATIFGSPYQRKTTTLRKLLVVQDALHPLQYLEAAKAQMHF